MSIISTDYLQSEMFTSGFDTAAASKAVARATNFINTWTSKHYYPWEDYQASPDLPLAPSEIVQICVELSKAYYFLYTNESNADGNRNEEMYGIIEFQKNELLSINVAPEIKRLSITLSSNRTQIIGSQNTTTGRFPQVIPFNANVISDSGNVWTYGEDYYIRRGGAYDDEYRDAWYLDSDKSDLEGTLCYLRTYRNDGQDYARHIQDWQRTF